MFSQYTNSSSCLSSEAPNCSLRETSSVSLLDSEWWASWGAICGGTLLHMMPQGHGRGWPWWAKMGSMMLSNNRWCWPYVMVHGIGGLADGCFVFGLGGLSARQCWAAVMIICCARHWAGWYWQNTWTCVCGLMAVT